MFQTSISFNPETKNRNNYYVVSNSIMSLSERKSLRDTLKASSLILLSYQSNRYFCVF